MNLLDFRRYVRNQSSLQHVTLSRLERIKKEGSPAYNYDVAGSLAAGTYVEIDIASQFPQAKKYEPLTWLEIVNNDAIDIDVYINGSCGDIFLVPASSNRTIKARAIWQIRVLNKDAATATTANKIRLTLLKPPKTVDDWANQQ